VNRPLHAARYLEPALVAELLDVSDDVIREHLRRGSLPGKKILGRWRVDLYALRDSHPDEWDELERRWQTEQIENAACVSNAE
jgi:hypothetical protein